MLCTIFVLDEQRRGIHALLEKFHYHALVAFKLYTTKYFLEKSSESLNFRR